MSKWEYRSSNRLVKSILVQSQDCPVCIYDPLEFKKRCLCNAVRLFLFFIHLYLPSSGQSHKCSTFESPSASKTMELLVLLFSTVVLFCPEILISCSAQLAHPASHHQSSFFMFGNPSAPDSRQQQPVHSGTRGPALSRPLRNVCCCFPLHMKQQGSSKSGPRIS